MSNSRKVRVEIMTITPTMAQRYLDAHNTGNFRAMNDTKVAEYADAMHRGDWFLGTGAIGFSYIKDGMLLTNGQHRLMACVRAGKSFKTIVIFGVDNGSEIAEDTGKVRTLQQWLKHLGYKNTGHLATSLGAMVRFKKGGGVSAFGGNGKCTITEAMRWLKSHKDIEEFVCEGFKVKHLIPSSLATSLWYLFWQVNNKNADKFFNKLAKPTGLLETDPIYLLNQVLTKNRGQVQHNRMPSKQLAGLTIKAWNGWTSGTEMTNLRFTAVGPRPENFPLIKGLE